METESFDENLINLILESGGKAPKEQANIFQHLPNIS